MLKRFRRRQKDERGAALIWIAGTLVILLSMAAFATDLGWILLWNARLQAAADAAALAGVVNLPGFPGDALADAELAAMANGFPVPSQASLTPEVLAENEYRVTLDTDINTFFLRLIGFDTFHLSQTAHAQYIKPVRLGSPSNQFGDETGSFWAAINGQYTEIQQGDPYASRCIEDSDTPEQCDVYTSDGTFREGGYYYGIEVAPGSSDLSVDFFDGGHYIDTPSLTGDTSWRWDWPSGQRGVYLEYNLFEPDETPTDPTDNSTVRCSDTFSVDNDTTDGHFNTWGGPNNCSVGGSLTEGIWVLQLPAPLYEGATKFAIRANVSGPTQPKVYGILDMSIYVNFVAGSTEPYLAEIRPEHAGKLFELDIWDLGDNSGPASIQILDPTGSGPSCSWSSSNSEPDGSSPTCLIDISNQKYNEAWLNVDIPIPDGYTCSLVTTTGCWWKVHIETTTGAAHDRTTWTARVSGDPVKLVD